MYKTEKKAKHKRRNFKKSRNKPKSQRLGIHEFIKEDQKAVKEKPFVPEMSFLDMGLDPSLLDSISKKGYKEPTEIQEKAILNIMGGVDLVGVAGTGTGKTAAFLIPIIDRLLQYPNHNQALIVAPTRELATQILNEFIGIAKGLNLYASCLIGGENTAKSISLLKRPNHVIIGTPGRLIDMMDRGFLKLRDFKTLVLDEFDRMLDMGFVEDVKQIERAMVSKEQTLLFSATINKSISGHIDSITNNAIEIKAEKGLKRNYKIEQEVIKVPSNKKKSEVIFDIVKGHKAMLFCETKRRVDQVHRELRNAGLKADLIHGDKTQKARDNALRKFRNGKVNILVATDVVARGIDVSDVSLVINFEAPRNYDDYVHRIGRTGRAGKTGRAITLV